jgi:hypothetical protein
MQPLIVSMLASLGSLLFFAYCAWHFGHWNLYMQTEQVGWQVKPDYLGVFSTRIFHIHWPHLDHGGMDPEFLSRLCVPVILFLFIGLLYWEWRLARRSSTSGWQERAGLYLCAWLMFYIPAAGHCSRGFSSMIRFALCIQVVLVMAAVHLAFRTGFKLQLRRRWASVLLALWFLASAYCQIALTYRFTHGWWVA